jgi:hypothetical protein
LVFGRRDYPERWHIIIDEGTDPVSDPIPADPSIRHFRITGKRRIDTKRNPACEQARGEIIVHCDDLTVLNTASKAFGNRATSGASSRICFARRLNSWWAPQVVILQLDALLERIEIDVLNLSAPSVQESEIRLLHRRRRDRNTNKQGCPGA